MECMIDWNVLWGSHHRWCSQGIQWCGTCDLGPQQHRDVLHHRVQTRKRIPCPNWSLSLQQHVGYPALTKSRETQPLLPQTHGHRCSTEDPVNQADNLDNPAGGNRTHPRINRLTRLHTQLYVHVHRDHDWRWGLAANQRPTTDDCTVTENKAAKTNSVSLRYVLEYAAVQPRVRLEVMLKF